MELLIVAFLIFMAFDYVRAAQLHRSNLRLENRKLQEKDQITTAQAALDLLRKIQPTQEKSTPVQQAAAVPQAPSVVSAVQPQAVEAAPQPETVEPQVRSEPEDQVISMDDLADVPAYMRHGIDLGKVQINAKRRAKRKSSTTTKRKAKAAPSADVPPDMGTDVVQESTVVAFGSGIAPIPEGLK